LNQEKLNIELTKLQQRRKFFSEHFPEIEGMKGHSWVNELDLPNTCPVCGFFTLSERDSWEVCGICYWEDDGQDDYNKDKVKGGPNGKHSLSTYRADFYAKIEKSKQIRTSSIIRWFHKLIEGQDKVDYSEIKRMISQLEKEGEKMMKNK